MCIGFVYVDTTIQCIMRIYFGGDYGTEDLRAIQDGGGQRTRCRVRT